jgi:hypothetical protein
MVVLLTSVMDSGAESFRNSGVQIRAKADRTTPGIQSDASYRMGQISGGDQVVFKVKIGSLVTSLPKRSNHRWHWVQREADGFSFLLFGIPRR